MDITITKLEPDSRGARELYCGNGAAIPMTVVLPGDNPFWFILNRVWDGKNYFAIAPDGGVLISGNYPDYQNTDTQNSVARAVLSRLIKEYGIEIPCLGQLVDKWRRTSSNWNCVFTFNKAHREWEYVQLQ